MEFEQSEPTFALLELPIVPLLHTLSFLPHSSLLPLAASCKFLHATVHNSSNLWRRLTLLPSMLILPTTTQSFIRVLRRHGSSVRAVKVKYTEERGMLENLQQLLAFLAASCPSLVHISLPYLTAFNHPPTNQLRLLVNSFPNLRSLTIKMYDSTSKGLEHLANLSSLENLHLVFTNDRKSQEKLSSVFASLKRLRRVTIGAVSYDPSRPRPVSAIFVKALVNSNPDLKEIYTDTWEGGVKVSKKDKSILKKKGIRHHEEDSIPDSDMETEEDDVEDEEESDEDSDGSEDRSEDSVSAEEENSESGGEESSEDEVEGGIEDHGGDEDDIEESATGADISSEERSSVWWRIASFTLLAFLFGNYLFANFS